MPAPSPSLRIATRESPLAMWQAHYVAQALKAAHPQLAISLVPMTTRGDQILDQTLSKIGGKGLFIRELEQALIEKRADIAVHSLKDVPMVLPDGFALAGILLRESPNDALVSNRYERLESLPSGAIIGTASLRRQAMIRARYPHLVIQTLRGNLGTRLRKLDEGHYSAIILACAGLMRLGFATRIAQKLPTESFIPSPGQGAIGIEIRADDSTTQHWLSPLICAETTLQCTAERAFAQMLEGGCEVPLAAYATLEQTQTTPSLRLHGWLANIDGGQTFEDQVAVNLASPIPSPASLEAAAALGQGLAKSFIERGADSLMASIRATLAAPTSQP